MPDISEQPSLVLLSLDEQGTIMHNKQEELTNLEISISLIVGENVLLDDFQETKEEHLKLV